MKIRGSEKKGLIVGIFLTIGLSAVHVLSQTGPLTYPQILTALNAKLPVGVTRTKLLSKLVTDVKSRKVDKPLTSDREDDLRQAGATDELIDAIRINSPLNPTKVETAERVDQKTDLAAADLLRWRESLRRRQGASVLAELSSVLNRDATNTQALWLRSTAYAQTRQFDKAEMDSRAVVNLLKLPKTAGDYGALCFATVSLQLWADSPANCNKAAELDPGFPEAHLGLGINRWVGKQFDLAIAEFTKAIGFDSRYAAAYFNRARAYQSKQQPDLAINDYSRAIEIDRNYVDAYVSKASIYAQYKQYDRAIPEFTNAITLEPTNVPAYLGRAISYLSTQQLALAESDYERVLQLDPRNMLAYLGRGLLHDLKGETDLAIADDSKAIEINPNSKEAYFNRGLARFHKKEYVPAIADYNRAIEIDPNYGAAYRGRSQAYDGKGDKQLADTDRKRADQLEGAPRLSRSQ